MVKFLEKMQWVFFMHNFKLGAYSGTLSVIDSVGVILEEFWCKLYYLCMFHFIHETQSDKLI